MRGPDAERSGDGWNAGPFVASGHGQQDRASAWPTTGCGGIVATNGNRGRTRPGPRPRWRRAACVAGTDWGPVAGCPLALPTARSWTVSPPGTGMDVQADAWLPGSQHSYLTGPPTDEGTVWLVTRALFLAGASTREHLTGGFRWSILHTADCAGPQKIKFRHRCPLPSSSNCSPFPRVDLSLAAPNDRSIAPGDQKRILIASSLWLPSQSAA